MPELSLVALVAACAAESGLRELPAPGFAFTHDNSRVEAWPLGLNAVTTKFVAEPERPDAVAASYWVVRTEPGADVPKGELVARVRVFPEFAGGAFEPLAGTDYELVLGIDRNGAESRELEPGLVEVRMPADARARQRGFVLRARFAGDDVPNEPPKSLLLELESVTDAGGRALPLGEPLVARWLIVEAAQAPCPGPAAAPRGRPQPGR